MYNEPLLEVSILGTTHTFKQNEGETVAEFKVRLQDYFDREDINIQVV